MYGFKVYFIGRLKKKTLDRSQLLKTNPPQELEREYRRDLSPERELTVEFVSYKQSEDNNTNNNYKDVAVVVKFSAVIKSTAFVMTGRSFNSSLFRRFVNGTILIT